MQSKNLTTKQVIEENELLKGKLSKTFYDKINSRLVRSKGSTYEKVAAAVVFQNAIDFLNLQLPEVAVDSKTFYCFDTDIKLRRCDIFLANAEIAYEIKSYRPCLNSFIRMQIMKDEWLLKNNKVKQIWWILFQSATPTVLRQLTLSGIVYLDVLGGDETFTNIPVLYDNA